MPPRPLLLATRASPLEIAQARQVARRLELRARVQVRLTPIVAASNALRAAATPQDKSRFVRGVDDAVLSGRAGVPVHSAKHVAGDRSMSAEGARAALDAPVA